MVSNMPLKIIVRSLGWRIPGKPKFEVFYYSLKTIMIKTILMSLYTWTCEEKSHRHFSQTKWKENRIFMCPNFIKTLIRSHMLSDRATIWRRGPQNRKQQPIHKRSNFEFGNSDSYAWKLSWYIDIFFLVSMRFSLSWWIYETASSWIREDFVHLSFGRLRRFWLD